MTYEVIEYISWLVQDYCLVYSYLGFLKSNFKCLCDSLPRKKIHKTLFDRLNSLISYTFFSDILISTNVLIKTNIKKVDTIQRRAKTYSGSGKQHKNEIYK